MGFTSREVLVPVVAGNAGGAVLGRIVADGHLPAAHPAKLEPEISELLGVGLYAAGQTARAAVRRLAGRPWPRPHVAALSVANPGELLGLAEENARSAELGLALALLLFRSQADIRRVLATGTLACEDGGMVRVGPVHHLRGKFTAIERHYRQAGIATPPRLMLVPEVDSDGHDVVDRYALEIRRLREFGITVEPAADLTSVARRLGALNPAWPMRARATIAIATLGVVLAGLSSAAALALWAPIPLAFDDAVAAGGGRILQTPFRAALESGGRWVPLPPCTTRDGMPSFRLHERVMLALRVGSPADWAGLIGGYHLSLVAVTTALVKVVPVDEMERSYQPGELMFRAWPVTDPAEPGPALIAVLAQRLWPFNRKRLEADLRSLIDPLKPGERFNAARLYLEQAAPGAIFYHLREIGENERCS